MTDVPIADVEARLTELLALAEAGEEVRITRRGKPVARLTPIPRPQPPRKPINVAELKALTDGMPMTDEVVQKMREDARY